MHLFLSYHLVLAPCMFTIAIFFIFVFLIKWICTTLKLLFCLFRNLNMFLAGFEEYEDTSIWFAQSKIKTKFSRLGWDRISDRKLLHYLLYIQTGVQYSIVSWIRIHISTDLLQSGSTWNRILKFYIRNKNRFPITYMTMHDITNNWYRFFLFYWQNYNFININIHHHDVKSKEYNEMQKRRKFC